MVKIITVDVTDPAYIKAKQAYDALEPREKQKFVDIVDWIFKDLEYIWLTGELDAEKKPRD